MAFCNKSKKRIWQYAYVYIFTYLCYVNVLSYVPINTRCMYIHIYLTVHLCLSMCTYITYMYIFRASSCKIFFFQCSFENAGMQRHYWCSHKSHASAFISGYRCYKKEHKKLLMKILFPSWFFPQDINQWRVIFLIAYVFYWKIHSLSSMSLFSLINKDYLLCLKKEP